MNCYSESLFKTVPRLLLTAASNITGDTSSC